MRLESSFYTTKIMLLFATMITLVFILNFRTSTQDHQILPPRIDEHELHFIQIYRGQARERRQFLLQYKFENFFYLVPEANCPKLIRLGPIGDGGKWICNPMATKEAENCVVYSFGLNNNIAYERDFMQFTNKVCKMRATDMNKQQDLTLLELESANVLITKIAAQTTENTTSFSDILKIYGDNRIEILKIDIEGTEVDILDQILAIPICQILIEVHINDPVGTVRFLEKISYSGFYLFAQEQNPTAMYIKEYSFIHETCMKQYDAYLLAKYLS